jgi:hypothetical protein
MRYLDDCCTNRFPWSIVDTDEANLAGIFDMKSIQLGIVERFKKRGLNFLVVALAVIFAILPLTDVLGFIGIGKGALAVPFGIPELTDVLLSTGPGKRAGAVDAVTAGAAGLLPPALS